MILFFQEAYIFKTFEEDFYDSYLNLEILGFIRCESDFKKFGLNINYNHYLNNFNRPFD